jgi:hypothetical protein
MIYGDELIGKPKETIKLGYKVEVPKPYDYYRNKTAKTLEPEETSASKKPEPHIKDAIGE